MRKKDERIDEKVNNRNNKEEKPGKIRNMTRKLITKREQKNRRKK